ncbi:hypothetical protein B5X24_HaOG214816 [Helicoverpa armigera]|uniref:Uncharacterized protein n=1 Tax=Helicoverpa armigera TaxID=29058 RepID=A0A2W1B6C6_HELAM|nr:hypothetical protein B5X24_HaOG214816 [Helicoverpa armigera]
MNQGLISPRLMVGAAIVGIVGAAGVFIYEQIYAEKRRAMLDFAMSNKVMFLFVRKKYICLYFLIVF